MAPSTAPADRHPSVRALAALRAIIGSMTRSARAIESGTGITNAQLYLLRECARGEPLSVNDLANLAQARQNAVSPVIRRLQAAGLVRSLRAADDRRRAVITLTPRGRRLLERAPAPPAETLIAALHRLRPRDARRLADGLHALVAALDLDVASAPLFFEQGGRPPRRRAVRDRATRRTRQ